MEHAAPPTRLYFIVYIILMVLLALTVAVAQLDIGALGILIALTIATIKAVLVMLYFMHVRYSSRLTWIFAASGFAWLVIMYTLIMSDYLSRGWVD